MKPAFAMLLFGKLESEAKADGGMVQDMSGKAAR